MQKPSTMSLAEATFSRLALGFTHYEACTSYFMKMDNNYCVNVGMSEYGTTTLAGQTWCYVSNECRDLRGGDRIPDKESFPEVFWPLSRLPTIIRRPLIRIAGYFHTPQPVPRNISWKLCDKGPDRRLRDMLPLEVLEMAESMDSVVGFVTKMAYQRLLPPEHTWDTVKQAVAAGDTAQMPKLLRDAIAAKEPIVVDLDPEGHLGQRIIHGAEVYELEQHCGPEGCGAKQWPFRRGNDVGEL
uniref:Uncharacterized protein n=1 Tax=Zooxanthella nutricula TaxID=1333877 RepID=A0A7S2NYL8_9DINO